MTRVLQQGMLLGIGNPLLDITVKGDRNLLNKYKMVPDNAILAGDDQKDIYKDLLDNHQAELTAGGSVQNSLRVCQWIIKKPKVCVFMGSVGRDRYSEILEGTATDDGVEVRYQYQDKYPTGTCAVIITDSDENERSLCANLAAAEKFTISHILRPENYQYVQKAKYYYLSGYFLTVSIETVLKVGEAAAKANKPFVTNLSATFICSTYKDSLMTILPYTDYLFGNSTEALVFGQNVFGIADVEEIAQKISDFPKINSKRKRVAVITNGPKPVLYIKGDETHYIEVPQISKEKIIDTSGAGDAFAGGFLSQLLLGRSVEECIKCGIWAAGHIIQHSGCTFDKSDEYKQW